MFLGLHYLTEHEMLTEARREKNLLYSYVAEILETQKLLKLYILDRPPKRLLSISRYILGALEPNLLRQITDFVQPKRHLGNFSCQFHASDVSVNS